MRKLFELDKKDQDKDEETNKRLIKLLNTRSLGRGKKNVLNP